MEKSDLLNTIAVTTKRKCLSDLHALSMEELLGVVEKLGTSTYNYTQWGYALSYILNRNIVLYQGEDIEEHILRLIQ